MKYFLTLLILPFLLLGQVDRPDLDEEKRKQGPFRGDMFKDRQAKMDRMKMLIKEKDPERFAELEKLKLEDMEKYKLEMRRTIKEFSEKFGKFKPPHGPKHGGERHWLREMKEKDSEKYESLMKLREDDPHKFREQMAKEFSSRMKKRPMVDAKLMEAIKKAVKEYHEAMEDQKETVKEKLRNLLKEFHEKSLESRRAMAERLEEHLNAIKTQIKESENKSEDVVEDRLNFLLNKTREK